MLGIDMDTEVYRTNTVRCRPRDERGKGRNSTDVEVAACSNWTEAEIRLVDPDVVLLFGKAVALAFPSMTPTEANGKVRAFNYAGRVRQFVGCVHPASVLYSRGKMASTFFTGLRTAVELSARFS